MIVSEWKHIYLVGIKGVAMTALAKIFIDRGVFVSGCDVDNDFVTEKALKKMQIKIDSGFDHELNDTYDAVIYTAAHKGIKNQIVQFAINKNIPTFSHAQVLGMLSKEKDTIAVCGVGGKSTVSAMISWILVHAKKSPSYSVGVGEIIGLDTSAQWSEHSTMFITEADEYAENPGLVQEGNEIIPRFHYITPKIIACTNIAFDHPDVYTSEQQTKKVFFDFFDSLPESGHLLINADAAKALPSTHSYSIITIGESINADFVYHVDDRQNFAQTTSAQFIFEQKQYAIKLSLPGLYNVQNAAFACMACKILGITIDESIKFLESFKSTQRRFQNMGVKNGIQYYDDYAHHPSELEAVLKALFSWYAPEQCFVVFQPHTYSRTTALFDEFVESLSLCQNLFLLPIYASARESLQENVNSELLGAAIKKRWQDNVSRMDASSKKVEIVESLVEINTICRSLPKGSVVITIGAGDVYKLHEMIT